MNDDPDTQNMLGCYRRDVIAAIIAIVLVTMTVWLFLWADKIDGK
jgi:hypothetical protein